MQKNVIIMIINLLVILFFQFNYANNKENIVMGNIRKMAVSNKFYSGDKDSLMKNLDELFKPYSKCKGEDSLAALIVPHAGYVFSGAVAAAGFSHIERNKFYKNIFLIGPSHSVILKGASVNNEADYYETPFGAVKVNNELANELISNNSCFEYHHNVHVSEHCLEVQLPYLQYWFNHMPWIVPIIIGSQSIDTIKEISNALYPYFTPNNLFIISSDFSHYPSYDDAIIVDKRTGDGILKGTANGFLSALYENLNQKIYNLYTGACGQSAIATLLYIVEKAGEIKVNHIKYNNSGDSKYGDKEQVVGYHAFEFLREKKKDGENDEKNVEIINEEEKKKLLELARRAITAEDDSDLLKKLTPYMQEKCGAFVTLTEFGHLRGCIGHFGNDKPLYQIVKSMAKAAAFEDPRFTPVSPSEMENVKIQISVLTPLKKINNIDEFKYGIQGIFIYKDGKSGTFLPEVAHETNWTKEEFLGHCSNDKAGLGWNGWKDADLYTYETILFNEN